jgi:phosphatidylinositol alpha-mannosyltransferase
MTPLRLVFVTRRYWPLAGGEATLLANLTAELWQLGQRPSVVTAQWEPHWPAKVICSDVPISRLAFPRHRPWGALRYMISLSRWLRDNASHCDLCCLSASGHESTAAISTLKKAGTPVVVRIGASANHEAKRGSPAALAQRLSHRGLLPDLFIATDPETRRELLHAGVQPAQVRLIPWGVPSDIAGNGMARSQARAALAEVNMDLDAPEHSPVGLYMGELRRDNGLDWLITAWSFVVRQRPDARLWIVGDGPDRGRLFRHIQDAELVGRVVMPGCFDADRQLLQAADLAVVPSVAPESAPFLLAAMSARLPVVAADSSTAKTTITPGDTGTLLPPDFPNLWADAIIKFIDHPQTFAAMAANAARMVHKYYSLRTMTQSHLNAFRDLVFRMPARS